MTGQVLLVSTCSLPSGLDAIRRPRAGNFVFFLSLQRGDGTNKRWTNHDNKIKRAQQPFKGSAQRSSTLTSVSTQLLGSVQRGAESCHVMQVQAKHKNVVYTVPGSTYAKHSLFLAQPA